MNGDSSNEISPLTALANADASDGRRDHVDVSAAAASLESAYDADVESAKHYGRAARSPRTRLEYARNWAQFARYCERAGLVPFPAEPQTVAAYLKSLAGKLKATTVQWRAAGIAFQHRKNGLAPPPAHPLVADVLAGITREHGTAPQRKAALTVELLREVLAAVDDGTLRNIQTVPFS